MRTTLLTLLLLPSIAFAEPGECTVTTTVKCTGDAAPYAIEAAKPQPPVVAPEPEPPVVAPPPVAAPLPPPPPQIIVMDPRKLAGDGWKLVQDDNGCLWRERRTSTPNNALWVSGLTLFLGGWVVGGVAGSAQGDIHAVTWFPIIGSMMNTAFSLDDSTHAALFGVDAAAQATGFVLFLVGLAAGPDKIERMPIHVGPTALVGGGSGVALSGRF